MMLCITTNPTKSVAEPIEFSPRKITPFHPSVALGARGDTVISLQQWLNRYVGPIETDGVFGPVTEFTVRTFQYRMFLPTSGVADPQTWDALMLGMPLGLPLLHLGSQCTHVRWAQAILDALGFYTEAIDGNFGFHTQTAVRRYQVSREFQDADGVVNDTTWATLARDRIQFYNPYYLKP
ncbi:MAG: peptidoglycan-binding protein [Cyanobacteria bacterium P01_F01_bin.53]